MAIKENDNFRCLDVYEQVVLAIEDRKFNKATEVQKRALPLVSQDENLIVAAPTGSGKTLIFASRCIEVTESGKGIQTLVLAPTRELAQQIKKEFDLYSTYKPLNIIELVGGINLKSKLDKIAASEIIIATPGKIVELINDFPDEINLSKIHMLIFDEMDAMLAPEFFEDIECIVSNIPRKRQTLMFSATITKEISKFAQKYMKRARRVLVEDRKNKKELEQQFFFIDQKKKVSLLSYILNNETIGLALVFVNRKEVGEFIKKNIKIKGMKFGFIHKDLSQAKREKLIEDFKDQKFDILIATDIAARGLDVEGITHVINYNIPKEQDKYMHRIGRTARAGNKGKSIDLVSKQDEELYLKILNEKKLNIYKRDLPENLEEIEIKFKMKARNFANESKKRK